MRQKSGLLIPALCLLAMVAGCSSGGNPVSPSDAVDEPLSVKSTQSGNHYLWSYHLIYVDPTDPEGTKVEIVPVRQVASHWNALSWLQTKPCTNCFKVFGIQPIGLGKISAYVEITHPFDNLNLTGFDVRGIPMFDASYTFEESGLTFSDRMLGDGELMNADGYTTLYNATTLGSGPGGLQGYIKGNLATAQAPNALLNGYKRHISEGYNPRNIFNAGDSVTATYEIDMPDGPFVFGYAVDANWAKAESTPVYDPYNDFGYDANCSEPWKLEITEEKIDAGLLTSGGSTKLIIDVYDRQGWLTHEDPVIECSQLFDGTKSPILTEYGSGYTRFELTITNENLASPGSYKILVSVEDNDNAGSPEWLDLTAYGIITVNVSVEFDFVDVTPDGLNWAPLDIDADGGILCSTSTLLGFNIFDLPPSSMPVWQSRMDVEDEIRTFDVKAGIAYTMEYDVNNQEILHFRDVDPPDAPTEISTFEMPLSIVSEDIQVLGNYAYVAGWEMDLVSGVLAIVDVSDPMTASVVSTVPLDIYPNRIALAVSDGYAYVIAYEWNTDNNFLYIIDTDPPETASVVNTLGFTDPPYDIASYPGYVCVTVGQELHIIDVDPPESASAVTTLPLPAYPYELEVADGYAYITCGIYPEPGWVVQVYDIDPPETASAVHMIELPPVIADDMTVAGTWLYLSHEETGFHVIDISNPESAWYEDCLGTPTGRDVIITEGYAYVGGLDDYMLQVLDIDPPESTTVVQTVYAGGRINDTFLDGDYIYIGSFGGLDVVDISAPESADVVKHINTPDEVQCLAVSGGYAYLVLEIDSSGEHDLQIMDIDPLESAYVVNTVVLPSYFRDIQVRNGYAHLGGYDHFVVDIDPPESAEIVFTGSGSINKIEIVGDYAYIARNWDKLEIFDISLPELPYSLSQVDIGFNPGDLDISDGIAYTLGSLGMSITDVDPPEQAFALEPYTGLQYCSGLDIEGQYAYITGYKSFHIIQMW